MRLFDDEITQPAEEWSFGYTPATIAANGVGTDGDLGDEDEDDEQSDPGGDSDVEPDPARR